MKKAVLTSIGVFMFSILFNAFAYAGGKPFEGIITYKISFSDSKFTESQLAMFPKLMIVSVKGTKSKSEMSTGMGNQIEITDYAEKTKVQLMDIMGQKYAIKETTEEIQKEIDKEPKAKVEVTTETKTIAGYTCKKAIVTTELDGEKTVYEVWFSEDLGMENMNFSDPIYKDINGALMEFSMKQPQFTMKFTVSSIEKKSVSAKEFEIPAEYKLITKEELKSKFGGGME
jgi:GLPGLI family protein